MIWLLDAFAWLTDPNNWPGPAGIAVRLREHLALTAAVVTLAALIALPIGLLIGHTGRGIPIASGVAGALRALPTLGVLTLVALWIGVGVQAPIWALVVLAIPSLLAASYSGLRAIDRSTILAARAVGMREWQILLQVEIPLASAALWSGMRAAVLQVVATATLAAYVGAGGLGSFLFLGLKTRDYGLMLGASLLVIALALVLDLALAGLSRIALPRGVRQLASRHRRSAPTSSRFQPASTAL